MTSAISTEARYALPRICASLLCFPALVFASTLTHQFARMSNVAVLVEAVFLTAACLLALVLLLRGDLVLLFAWLRNRS